MMGLVKHDPLKRVARCRAKDGAHKRFVYPCVVHGSADHYTATGRCVQCDALAKTPEARMVREEEAKREAKVLAERKARIKKAKERRKTG
jgi:hypothetical protein